jgi:hypothetical protein
LLIKLFQIENVFFGKGAELNEETAQVNGVAHWRGRGLGVASCHTTNPSSNLASFARPPVAAPYVDGLALSVEASRDGASLVAGFDCVGSRVCGFGIVSVSGLGA